MNMSKYSISDLIIGNYHSSLVTARFHKYCVRQIEIVNEMISPGSVAAVFVSIPDEGALDWQSWRRQDK